jgi:hypothetical protein
MTAAAPRYFAGIGAQKAGTTWIGDYLRRHPQVYMPPVKELHVFDRIYRPDISAWLEPHFAKLAEGLARRVAAGRKANAERLPILEEMVRITTLAGSGQVAGAYRSLFLSRLPGACRAFGEITPAYALLPPVGLAALLEAFPEARLFFVMRDPVDRYWSGLNQRARFEKELVPHRSMLACLAAPGLGEASDYKTTIERLERAVPKDQLHLLFYEDLFGPDGQHTVDTLTGFLGIEPVPADLGLRVYASDAGEPPTGLVEPAARAFAATYQFVAARFPDLPARWREHMRRASLL